METTIPVYDISASNDTIVQFNVEIPGIFVTEIDSFARVNIKEHSKMDSTGFPEMPFVSFLVATTDCDSVNLQLALLDSMQYNNYKIYPAPRLVPDTIAGGGIALIEQFEYDRQAYETDAMFPGYAGEVVEQTAIRAQNVVRVVIYPLQFNPVKDIIKVYSDFQITLTFNNPMGSLQKNVGFFNEVVGNSVINYQSNGLNASVSCGAGSDNTGTIKWVTSFPNDYVEDSCDYLIITHEDFYNDVNAKSEIEALAQHRAVFNGFNVVMTITDSIYAAIPDSITVDIDKKIKIFLNNTYEYGNAYHTYDGKLAYINLFGDAFFGNNPLDICVPTHSEGYDIYFTQLTWDSINGQVVYDDFPDIMIGRCSVDTATQVQNVVHKILKILTLNSSLPC